MGSKQSMNSHDGFSQLKQSRVKEQFQGEKDYCNCLLPFPIKCKKNLLVWETKAINYCKQFKGKSQWRWAEKIIDIVRGKNVERVKFMKQFNNLCYLQKKVQESEKEQRIIPEQIITFQSNLKKSVFLSFQEFCNNEGRSSKIQSDQDHCEGKKEDNFTHEINTIINQTNLIVKPLRQSLKKAKQKTNGKYLRQSVANLVNDAMSSIFRGEQKQVYKLSAYALQIFVKFTVMLEKHLNDPQHQIYGIIQCFTDNLQKNFTAQKVKQSSQRQRKLSGVSQINELQLQKLIKEIKKFIALLDLIVYDYYNISAYNGKQDGKYYLIGSIENIKIINTAILFKGQKFYKFIFEIVREFNENNQFMIEEKYQQLHGKPPQFFQIKRQYCLNSASFKHIMQEIPSTEKSNITNFSPENLMNEEQPYAKCSQTLLKITSMRTPIGKMKVIMQCAELITKIVVSFYEKHGLTLKNRVLDADTILSIFRYILTLNKIENLFSHVFLIEMFLTQQQKTMSINGYYLTVLRCAIEKNFGDEDEQHLQGTQIQMFIDDEPKQRRKTKTEKQRKSQIQISKINEGNQNNSLQ